MLLREKEGSLEKKGFAERFFFKRVETKEEKGKFTKQRQWSKIPLSNATMNFMKGHIKNCKY